MKIEISERQREVLNTLRYAPEEISFCTTRKQLIEFAGKEAANRNRHRPGYYLMNGKRIASQSRALSKKGLLEFPSDYKTNLRITQEGINILDGVHVAAEKRGKPIAIRYTTQEKEELRKGFRRQSKHGTLAAYLRSITLKSL